MKKLFNTVSGLVLLGLLSGPSLAAQSTIKKELEHQEPERVLPARIEGKLELLNPESRPQCPDVALHAQDAAGATIASARIGAGGQFQLSLGGKAAWVLVGPADADPKEERLRFLSYRASEFVQLAGREVIRLPEKVWLPWLPLTFCVTGNVRRCFPFLWWINSIVQIAQPARLEFAIPELQFKPQIFPPPHYICSPVCQGVVQVYRRVCCCYPQFPPLLDFPVEWPPIPIPIPEPDPIPPPWPFPPGPGPDPAPMDLLSKVLTGNALDSRKLNLERDRAALTTIAHAELEPFLRLRPYFWCTCGPPVKVAEGFLASDGSFSICWQQPWIILAPNCHEKFAYKVIQSINGFPVTIYDGVAAGQWFEQGDDPTLTSYSPVAVTCSGDPDIPGTGGRIVLLDEIGHTESWRLGTPDQDSPDSVFNLTWNSGLLDPNSTDGPSVNRNLGGTLGFRYFISEGMQAIAKYYRVMVAPADAAGDPADSFAAIPSPVWRSWLWTGAGWLSQNHSLGPVSVGSENDLRHIPYDGGGLLAANEEWADDQYHAVLNSTLSSNGRYLVRIEVFDASGNRIKPTGAIGSGTNAAFQFGRWKTQTGPVQPVPYAALSHALWWDNRPAVAIIEEFWLDGVPDNSTCQFLSGSATSPLAVGYRAYHPNVGTPLFLARRWLRITKGLGGGTTTLVNGVFGEVGEFGLPEISPSVSLGTLLGSDPRCAFGVHLTVHVKTTNGSGPLIHLNRTVHAAFAASQSP